VIELVFDFGPDVANKRFARGARITIVDTERSDWEHARLTAGDALRLAWTPLMLLVENWQNDYAFLRRLARPSWRSALDEALDKGWLDVGHGGGLPEIRKRLEALKTASDDDVGGWVRRLRLWVMFDRDADRRDRSKPSVESERVRGLCEALRSPWPVAAHQLHRRSIENYLPKGSLFKWANQARGRELTSRRRKVEAFFDAAMSDTMRHYFNMKKGFLGDLDGRTVGDDRESRRALRDSELDNLFRGLPSTCRRHLRDGFGNNIGELFKDRKMVHDQWLAREVPKDERDELPASIFSRI
jgi:hypothetical protein